MSATARAGLTAEWLHSKPVLAEHGPALANEPPSWGLLEADALITGDVGWRELAADAATHNPSVKGGL